jgi:hypothetical protein
MDFEAIFSVVAVLVIAVSSRNGDVALQLQNRCG